MKLKKDITFIYSDSAEKEIYKPIAAEAEKRGYKVNMTNDVFAKCEIGFYCQHVNLPQFSKFSVIMLHDVIQQYGAWPDLWLREPWNKYDVGFLPSTQWIENWNRCSQWYYANPRIGMFKLGWPKADNYASVDKESFKKKFCELHGLDVNKRTVLYAPAWENDNKQDDFVKAMQKLDVNILIKQAPMDPNYSLAYKLSCEEVKRMYELHKDISGVTILDPKTNIFDAILACDVLVSEESSTMCEATMMGIPAISVSDWLIPDVNPHRYPTCKYDFVTNVKKDFLSDSVAEILSNYNEKLTEVERFREKSFGEIGGCSEIVMDIIDDCVNGNKIRYQALPPAPRKRVPLKREIYHLTEGLKRELYYNYNKRYKAFHFIYEPVRKLKKKIEGRA